jgi:hypothetical protein
MKRSSFATLLAACALAVPSFAFNPPTMGWSSWNTFALNINEGVIKSQADAMVKTGLAKAGYKYINIDDGYWDGRADDGTLRIDKVKFPNGMRAVADYIHRLGLKAGIYSDAGDNTCGSGNRAAYGLNVGLYKHELADCKTYFDDWDYDFIKVDYCGGNHAKLDERAQYTKISNAIKSVKKKGVVFNVCRWAYPGTWISDIADSWRTTGDIYCAWKSVRSIIRENLYIQAYTGGGHYNDADMLEIGRTLSHDEEITHMAYWCIASSPLLIGCDMTTIPEFSLNLLKNKDLLAMNQDKLGLGAPVVQRDGEVYVVAKDMKKLQGPKRAVVVMNLTDESKTIEVSVEAMGFTGGVKVYDCLSHQVVATNVEGTYQVSIPAHGSRAFFVTGKRAEKKTYQAEEAWLKAYQELGKQGTAIYMPAKTADQGEYVGYLGHSADNYLEWRNVYSKKGGPYTISIRYAINTPRNMQVSVNGTAVKELKGLCSMSDNYSWNTVEVPVVLKKGMNTVRLSNDNDWMPNIDCMTLRAL